MGCGMWRRIRVRESGPGARTLLRADIGAITKRFAPSAWADPDVVPYAAKVSIWGRWIIWLVSVFNLASCTAFHLSLWRKVGFLGEADTVISTTSSSTEGPPSVVAAISALNGWEVVSRGAFRSLRPGDYTASMGESPRPDRSAPGLGGAS